ncbi:MAG: hypothetical protein EZS28_008267 [Streblomastix strix]|uniref:SPRY domain-containing protein n=2 Tax=Streblomastix strix TaxID=222440 RepID=A0A5J4WNQ3_9EUKA|nr:MAG: hypothetical protein EZS28_008267 [Streblomastix strix]
MTEIPASFLLNPKEVFEALGVSMSGVSEDQQARIATFLAKSARSLKHAIKDHERGISIESQLASALSLTSEQASMSCAPFHQILQDEGKAYKVHKKESDESSSESDSSSSSDEKSSSSSDSDDYTSMAEKQVPIAGRIRKYQGKFMQIPFDLTGATGVTQAGNLVSISSTTTYSIFFNQQFNEGVWRIYFKILKNSGSQIVIGIAEPSFSSSSYMGNDRLSMDYNYGGNAYQNSQTASGNKSYQTNDIVGFEVDMISHRIYFFHTFQQQPVCFTNVPAILKVGISYNSTNDAQFSVFMYKLKKPLADPTKSPTIKTCQLALELRSSNEDLHVNALRRLLDILLLSPQSAQTIKQLDIVGILKNFLSSEEEPELLGLSVGMLMILGERFGISGKKHCRCACGAWALVQIILSSDEVLSRSGSDQLCKLIESEVEIRRALLCTNFIEIVIEQLNIGTLTQNQQSSSSSSTSSSSQQQSLEGQSTPNYIKSGLLAVVLKLAEGECLGQLSSLIPCLEILMKCQEKELKGKAGLILGRLHMEGITTSCSSKKENEQNELIRQLEESNRIKDDEIHRIKVEKDRLNELNQKKDKVIRRKEEQNQRRISELIQQIALNKPKQDSKSQNNANSLTGEIPLSISSIPGTFIKEDDEFTYTSTADEYKTFTVNSIITKGVTKYEIKLDRIKQFIFGMMKSGLIIPNGKYANELSYAKDSMIFRYCGRVFQNRNGTSGNQQMKTDDTVAIEVNMNSNLRTAILFINNKQQPVFVSGLPESVQFYFTIFHKEDSVTAISLKQLKSPTSTGILGAKEVKWT